MSFKATVSQIPGCFLIEKPRFHDERGDFFKMFDIDFFAELSPGLQLREIYFSTSKKNVLRGLHFQIPPHDHVKIVSCLQGRVLDVILDLRKGSPTEGRAISFELKAEAGQSVLIPRGCAHGFYALEDDSLMAYLVETAHAPSHDQGILWSSIPFAWPPDEPLISARDSQFPALKDFKTPFHWQP